MQEHTYELQINCPCPSNPDLKSIYQATIVADHMIPVEDLLGSIWGMTEKPMFQEELTDAISSKFRADVTLWGMHSGVTITSHCWLQAMPSPTQMGPIGR